MGFILPVIALAAAGYGGAAAAGFSTLAAVGTAATVASAGASAIGSIESANAQKNAASYQSQVAANQQQVASQQANQTIAAGDQAAANEGLKTRATIGAIKAAQGASNIDVNTGSALDTRASAAELGELNSMTVRSNAAKQAYGYQSQAVNFGAQSDLLQQEASQAGTAGLIGATGSLLSGASSVGNNYAKWQLSGGGGTLGGNSGGAVGGNQVIFGNS